MRAVLVVKLYVMSKCLFSNGCDVKVFAKRITAGIPRII